MPKGVPTPPEVVEKIKVCLASGMTYSEVARIHGMDVSTVTRLHSRLLKNEDEARKFKELQEKKKKEMEEQANKDFDVMMKKSFEDLFKGSVKVIKKAMDEEKLSPREAVTILGTTFDKRQIMTGGKTQNISITYEDILKEINKGEEY